MTPRRYEAWRWRLFFRLDAYAVFVFGDATDRDTIEWHEFAVLVFEEDDDVVVLEGFVFELDHLDVPRSVLLLVGDLVGACDPFVVATDFHHLAVFGDGDDSQHSVFIPVEVALFERDGLVVDVGVDM